MNDLDQRELKHKSFKPFLAELPTPAKDLTEAYEALTPTSVLEAKTAGLKVEQIADWFFIPVKAPVLPVLSTSERLLLLGAHAHMPSNTVTNYLAGQDVPGHADQKIIDLMEKVPRPQDLIEGTRGRTVIEIDKNIYCKDDITHYNYTTLNLSSWHRPVQSLAKSRFKTRG